MDTQTPTLASALELATHPNSIPLARQFAVTTLRQWRTPEAVIETSRLLVSELATNTLPRGRRYEATPATYRSQDGVGYFLLRLKCRAGWLYISVRDGDPNPPVLQRPAATSESGRGLLLVSELSRRWGFDFDGPYKTVWCQVSCATAIAM